MARTPRQWSALALRIALIAVTAVAALLVVALLALRTSWGERQLAGLVAGQVEATLDGQVSIGSIEGDIFRSPTVRGVRITREGQPLIVAERIDLEYDLLGILGGEMNIASITLVSPEVHLREGPDGQITLFELFKPEETDPDAPDRPFALNAITIVDGRVLIGPGIRAQEGVNVPEELRELQARLAIDRDLERTQVAVEALSFVTHEPRVVLRQLTGGVRLEGEDLILQQIDVKTGESSLVLDGSIAHLLSGEGAE